MKLIDAEKLKVEIEKNTPDRLQLLVYRDIILSLIDSLQQEQQEEPDKSLEEAADKYLDGVFGKGKHQDFYVQLFIAGAKWQRQQMLKEAVEGNIHLVGFNNAIFIKEPKAEILDRYNVGDKVRIVVLKSE